MDVRAALREGAYALTAHSRVRSELPEDGPCLHVGFRREAFRVEFARLGEVLPIHLVRPHTMYFLCILIGPSNSEVHTLDGPWPPSASCSILILSPVFFHAFDV